jgi:hypothetical protein
MSKIVLPILLLLSFNLQAEIYFELDLEGGGDTLIGTTSGQDINVGGGVKFAAGVVNQVGDNGESLSLSLGYMFDNIDAINGTAEIDTLTFDAIYSIQRDRHRFGIGASYHMGPTYEDDIFGFSPLKFEFDDALGLILQYGYAAFPGFYIGARFTEMDYEVSGLSLDASSFGIFLSNGF